MVCQKVCVEKIVNAYFKTWGQWKQFDWLAFKKWWRKKERERESKGCQDGHSSTGCSKSSFKFSGSHCRKTNAAAFSHTLWLFFHGGTLKTMFMYPHFHSIWIFWSSKLQMLSQMLSQVLLHICYIKKFENLIIILVCVPMSPGRPALSPCKVFLKFWELLYNVTETFSL